MVCEYVDDILPGPALLPKDPYERARARMWVRFADSRLYARTEALLHNFEDKLHAAIVSELAESWALSSAMPSPLRGRKDHIGWARN